VQIDSNKNPVAKGQACKEGRELTRYEQLNIEADLLADTIREEARWAYGARPNLLHWPEEKATLFIQGKQVTSSVKQQLSSQLFDRKLKDYIIEVKKLAPYTFDSVASQDYEMAFTRLYKIIQVNISNTCFNL
jgi:hypothetical protein